MKRILAIVVCIAMILPLFPVIGSAVVVSDEVYLDFNDYAGATSYGSYCNFGTACEYGTAEESRGTSIRRYNNTAGEYINTYFQLDADGVFGFSFCPNDSNLTFTVGGKGSSGAWDDTALNGILSVSGATIKTNGASSAIYTGEIGTWIDVAIGIDFTNHKKAIFINNELAYYGSISENVTMVEYFNINFSKNKMSDTYVEGDEELTNEDYASAWFDDMFAYLSDGNVTADIASYGADPLKVTEINIDFGEKVICADLASSVTLNGEAVAVEAIWEHGYVTGVKLTNLSLAEKTSYTVAFPGIVDVLNKNIENIEFSTGLNNKSFSISVDGADETYAQDTKIIVDITAENITGDIEIYHNGELSQTVSSDTRTAGIYLAGGKNTICAKVPSLDYTSNTVTIEAIPYEIIKYYVDENMEDEKLNDINVGPAKADKTAIWSIVDTDEAHGKSLYVEKDKDTTLATTNSPYVNTTSAAGGRGVYVYEADIKYSQVEKSGVFFSLKTSGGSNAWGNTMYTLSNGNITNKGVTLATIEADTWYNFKVTYDMSKKTSEFYVDGVRVAKDIPMTNTDFTEILYVNTGIPIIDGTTTYMYMDNIKAYFKAKKFDVAASFGDADANNVPCDNAVITLEFDQFMNDDTLKGISITDSAGNAAAADFTTEDSITYTATVSVLEASSKYTIDLSGVLSAAGLGGNVTSVAFSTQKAPVIFEAEDYVAANGGATELKTLFMDVDDPTKLYDVTGVRLVNNFMNATTFTEENKAAIYAKDEGVVFDIDSLVSDGKVNYGTAYSVFVKASSLASDGADSLYSYKKHDDGSGTFLTTVGGAQISERAYPAYYGIPGVTPTSFTAGSGFTAARTDVTWTKVTETTFAEGDSLWIIGREPAFADKIMLVPSDLGYTKTEAAAYEAEKLTTYTASFEVEGSVLYTVEFEPGTTELSKKLLGTTSFESYTAEAPNDEWAEKHPNYASYFDYNPSTDTKNYKWADYTLTDSDTTIGVVETNGAVPVLDSIFGDGMMLQRNESVEVYGECAVDGVTIEVSIDGQTKTAVAKDGKWSVILDPMQANDSTTLEVSAIGGDNVTINDVAIGEIWICAGQSNMDFRLDDMEDYDAYKTEMAENNIRLFTMSQSGTYEKQDDVKNGEWMKASSSAAGYFPAIGYVMAEKLHNTLGVPVGLIMANRGGTDIDVWVSAEVIKSRAEYADHAEQYDAVIADKSLNADGSFKDVPSAFYNNMIYPLMPYTVNGVIWYQGCNNASDDQAQYKLLFEDMVNEWRTGFNNADMPFITFQLAPHTSSFMAMRQTQLELSQELDNVYLISTANEGYTYTEKDEETGAIHPYRKSPLGIRAAHTALNCIYGDTSMGEEYSAPVPASAYTVNDNMYLTFAHTGTGLKVDTTTFANLEGFEVSSDGVSYADATATIEADGKTVKLTSDAVSAPEYVRYGYITQMIEYTDGTYSAEYDSNKTVLRSTLGGNLTNNTGYPAPAFSFESSSVEDNRGYAEGISGNVLWKADGSEFADENGSLLEINKGAMSYSYTNTNNAATFSVTAPPVDYNNKYGQSLKIARDGADLAEFRINMPDQKYSESFALNFSLYAGTDFKLVFRPYYYVTDATLTTSQRIMYLAWKNLTALGTDKSIKVENTWIDATAAFDLKNDVVRIYINKELFTAYAIENLESVAYITLGFEKADKAIEGYLDNVSVIKMPDINPNSREIKVVDSWLANANADETALKFSFTNKTAADDYTGEAASVTTEYADEYRGNVYRYVLPEGVTVSNVYGVIGTNGASETVTVGTATHTAFASVGKEFVFEIDVKFDDFNYNKAFGSMVTFVQTDAASEEYKRIFGAAPFSINTSGKFTVGGIEKAQLETGKWYSFKAVYNFGTEDTDLPVIKVYLDGAYMGEMSAKHADYANAEYYDVDYIGYISYNFGAVGDAGSALSVDNIRFYTTAAAADVPAYVEYVGAYRNGKALNGNFESGALKIEAFYHANDVESSTVTMVAARYKGNKLVSVATKAHAVGTDANVIDVTLTDEMMQDVTSDDYIKVMFMADGLIRPVTKSIGNAK